MERDGPQPERGIVRGRHYTEYVEVVKALKRQGALEEAEALLLEMIEALENESRATGLAFAPWYYEQIAMVRHIKRDFGGEVAIIERCLALYTGPSGPRDALIRRPDRAGESQTRAKREHTADVRGPARLSDPASARCGATGLRLADGPHGPPVRARHGRHHLHDRVEVERPADVGEEVAV